MVNRGFRVFTFPFSGYWVDVGTVETYWQAQMDLLKEPPSINLNDRSWIIHTRTEERPPARINRGATVIDSMITHGCEIAPGALVERSILSPGVHVGSGAVIRESVILSDTVIEAGSTVECTIIDKKVHVGEKAVVGARYSGEGHPITMIGKNSQVTAGMVVEAGAVIATDVVPSDYPSDIVRSGAYIQTERLAYEV
jgi:glucose-1-phosphate adenylyltransferase